MATVVDTPAVGAVGAGDDLLGPTQAAQRIGVSTSRIRQLVDDGTLPHVRTPLGRLLVRAAVEDYARQRAARRAGISA